MEVLALFGMASIIGLFVRPTDAEDSAKELLKLFTDTEKEKNKNF